MKRLPILIVGLLLAWCVARAASSYLFIGDLVTVNNTTNSTAAVNVGTFSPVRPTFYFQNAGLTATNALRVDVQLSLDATNWMTLATYHPAGTNATNEAFSPAMVTTLYMRSQVVTTNSVQVGATLRL